MREILSYLWMTKPPKLHMMIEFKDLGFSKLSEASPQNHGREGIVDAQAPGSAHGSVAVPRKLHSVVLLFRESTRERDSKNHHLIDIQKIGL